MGILQWIKDWLTASKKPSDGWGHPDLHPIDIDEVTKELDLLVKAKELGERGLPASDAKMLTGSEADIVRTIERHRQSNVEWAVRRLAMLSESLSKKQVNQQVNQASQAHEEFARKASLQLANFKAQLNATGKQAKAHQDELEEFKTENRLVRQSQHQDAAGSFVAYAIVVFFIFVESAANAVTFSQGLDGGVLEGIFQAAMFAAANVLIAFSIGKWLVRQGFHRNWFRKIIGATGVALGIVCIGCMALLIMHYRDSLSTGIEDAATAARQSLITQPLAFADIFSIMLCAVSIGFGIFALLDGLFSDDLYPGYGAATRRAKKSLDAYEADLSEARDDLEELKEETLVEFEDALSRSQGVIAMVQNDIEEKRTTSSRLATAMQDADHSLSALLRRFRTENEKYRGNVLRPAYFDEFPTLPPVPLPNFDVGSDIATLNAQRTMVEALVAQSQEIRARIQASFSQQFDSLKTLDATFASQEKK